MANMKSLLLIILVIGLVDPSVAFLGGSRIMSCTRSLDMAVVTKVETIAQVDSPDFYWQFRLDRLVLRKSDDLSFNAANYAEAASPKAQYDAYYLDLTLKGKMEGFDWKAEKEITDSEWLNIYKNICKWSETNYKKNKRDNTNLPTNDFDLLKQFYPQLNMRDLETPFVVDEVGDNFPYTSMGEMLSAAVAGNLAVPGYTAASVTSIEAVEVAAELQVLKTETMAKIDAVYATAMAFAQNAMPDEEAKAHYKALKGKLASFPQTPAAWASFRADMEKEVDEMARLASKKVEHHTHGEDSVSPSAEFEAKYGKSLDDMQSRMDKFKSDPEGFLESSIKKKFGQQGLDVWKKSQVFANDAEVMSAADKAAAEDSFLSFLGNV